MRNAFGKLGLFFVLSVGLTLLFMGFKFEHFEWVGMFPQGFNPFDGADWHKLVIASLKPIYAILGTWMLIWNWQNFPVLVIPPAETPHRKDSFQLT